MKKVRSDMRMLALFALATFATVSVADVFITNISLIVAHYEWQPAIVL